MGQVLTRHCDPELDPGDPTAAGGQTIQTPEHGTGWLRCCQAIATLRNARGSTLPARSSPPDVRIRTAQFCRTGTAYFQGV